MLDSAVNSLRQGSNTALVILVLCILMALQLAGAVALGMRVRRLNQRLRGLTHSETEGNLEEVLTAHLSSVHQAIRQVETLEQAVAVLQAQIPGCLQRVGMVRYDAFEDVGGEQSFSAALLNAQGDGLVLTSVYGRNSARVYAKSIRDGRASHALSEDEQRALKECRTG